jgi:hypothetical protein
MAFKLNDRVKESSSTTGTGTFTLGGAVTGFETFAAGIGGGNTTYYCIFENGTNNFEVGFGTLNGGASTLARTNVISSSNSDGLVNFAGATEVFCTVPGAKISLPKPEEYGSSSAPKIITVKVGTKTTAHPYSGQGSSSAYFFDGLESPAITFSGADSSYKYYYRFDQSDSTNSGHPLRFYLEADKTTAYTTGVTTNGTAGSSGAYTQIAVDVNTPNVLYYQCSSHSLMGNFANVISNDFNGNVNLRGDATVADDKKIKFGAGTDLEIFHDTSGGGTDNIIQTPNVSHSLRLKSDSILLQGRSGASLASFSNAGTATLAYNGSTKLSTINTGIQTSGTVNVNGAYTLPTSDGSANQILETDGSGAVTFVDKPSAGASAGFAVAMAIAL